MEGQISRHRTAIHRPAFSRPIRLALKDAIVNSSTSVLDYGCGYGDDIRRLAERGIDCAGWDPAHKPDGERHPADVINLGYVVNVIEDSDERAAVLSDAWRLARKVLVVAARLSTEAFNDGQAPYEDGCVTRSGTFQRYFEQRELGQWIEQVVEVPAIAAGPGVYYLFRDDRLRESFVASRFRVRTAAPRQRSAEKTFERYKNLLQPLVEFVALRGRLPDESELEATVAICAELGSLRRAFRVIIKATGQDEWARIREERSQDLLVYLALSKFGTRARFSRLPQDLQLDVRSFFSTYHKACEVADKLLFSAGDKATIDLACTGAPVGKLTPTALYIHQSALSRLTPVLRVYEGCARVLIGTVEGANVIKLYRDKPQVSYLQYPGFDEDPHPALAASLLVDLQTFRIKYREYTDSDNPPILHRKEEFLTRDHPLRGGFAALTRGEEAAGLYDTPSLIGTRRGWEQVLEGKGVRIDGGKVVSRPKGV